MAKKSLVSKFLSKLPVNTAGGKEETAAAQHKKNIKLKFAVFIIDWQKANIVTDILVKENVRFHFTCMGRGTANSDVLDLIGIGSPEKAVITCLEQDVGVPILLKEVWKKISKFGPGAGIAFTIPLSAINDPVLLLFKQSIIKNEKIAAAAERDGSKRNSGAKGANMAEKILNDLIICVVSHGSSDDVMNTARAAGATGGTVINARGTAHEGAVKFFGVSVQDEKEMILILVKREKKVAIMQSICEKHGLNSETQGIVFSLPVDSVMGLSME